MLKRTKTAVTLAAGAMALGLLGAAPVAATTTTTTGAAAPAVKTWDDWSSSQRGVVIAKPGILIRSQPTTASHKMGFIDRGEIVWIDCKVDGQDVWGNGIWYKLSSHNGYLAARYVKNVDHIPYC